MENGSPPIRPGGRLSARFFATLRLGLTLAFLLLGATSLALWPLTFSLTESVSLTTYDGPWSAENRTTATCYASSGVLGLNLVRNDYTSRDWTADEIAEMRRLGEAVEPSERMNFGHFTQKYSAAQRQAALRKFFSNLTAFRYSYGLQEKSAFDSSEGLRHALVLATPLWFDAVLFLLAAWFTSGPLRRSIARRRREAVGRCGRCGYDLRGLPLQCPECGEMKL